MATEVAWLSGSNFIYVDVHPLIDAPLKTGLPGSGFFSGIRP
jgi:hypothetical protein